MATGQGVASSGAGAFPRPDGAGPQDAPQLAGPGQIGSVPGPQREVLGLPWKERVQASGALAPAIRKTWPRIGEPVIRVRPDAGLLRIDAGSGYPLGERRQLVAAALSDRGERHRVPREIESDLVWLPGTVVAADRYHRQDRPIYAA